MVFPDGDGVGVGDGKIPMTLTRMSILNDGDKNEQTCKTIVDAVANVMKNSSMLVCLEQRTVAHNVLKDIGIMLH